MDHSLHTNICAPLTQDYAPFYSRLHGFGGELKGDLVTGCIAVSQQQRLSVNAYSALLPIKAFIIVEILLLFLRFVKRLRKKFFKGKFFHCLP